MVMTRRGLLKHIDLDRIVEAIRQAEERTSGEIRVSVSTLFWGDVEKAARKAFTRMEMDRTKERNGILFFVVPSRRQFVVLGDEGIHARVGQEFWKHVAGVVSEEFHAGLFTEGLVKGIEAVGDRLASHFPYRAGEDENELPNIVDEPGC